MELLSPLIRNITTRNSFKKNYQKYVLTLHNTDGIRKALIKCKDLNMTAEAKTKLNKILNYLGVFKMFSYEVA